MHGIRRFCCALTMGTTAAASAQWTVLYDSQGFEHWDTGSPARWITIDDPVIWEVSTAGPGEFHIVSGATDPTRGDRSLRLDLGPSLGRVELVVNTGLPRWTPRGTRGIRIRFDVRRTPAEYMDRFAWEIETPGLWEYKGGYQTPIGVGQGSRTALLRDSRYTITHTDQWTTIEHVFNFWDRTATGRYGDFRAEMAMTGCCETGSLRYFRLAFVSPLVPGAEDNESVWIDNLIIGVVGPCPADCDRSLTLDFFDYLCFQEQFAAGDPAADCDGSGGLDLQDFLCFQNAFAAGCAI